MDLQSALICAAVFLLSAAILLFISWFGIKQKSYEEAIAEQRDNNTEFIDTKAKLKLAKEKKLRKQEKRKNKEKTSSSSELTSDETTHEPASDKSAIKVPTIIVKNQNPGHVDFNEEPAVIPVVLPVKAERKSKREQTRMSVKPILVNREPSPVITYAPIDSPKIMNHFEIIHPKDDKELLKTNIIEKNGKNKKNKKSKDNNETEPDSSPDKNLKVKSDKSKTSPKPIKESEKVIPKVEKPIIQKKVEIANTPIETKKSPQAEKNKKNEKKEALAINEVDKAKKAPLNLNNKKVPNDKKRGGSQKSDENEDQNIQKVVEIPDKIDNEIKDAFEKGKKNKKDLSPRDSEKSYQEKPKVVEKQTKDQNGFHNGYLGTEEPVTAVQTISSKESKKRKRELNALQQMSGDNTGVNVSLLVPLIRKAELSRSEVQILIDLLLNKQLDAPLSHEEWFEGRSDPVVKLKKQLAERVKLFEAEQEAHAGVAAKLREVRTELNSCLQAKRQVEEVNAQALNERQQIISRLQINQEHWQAEKQMLQKQIQQLQAKLTEEKHMARQFKEEHSKLQSQRQQLEAAVNRLSDQHNDSDNALKTQIGSLHQEVQEHRNVANSLRMDLHAVGADADSLRERLAILQPAAEQAQELARQLEDSRRTIAELEQRLTVTVNNAQVMNEKINHLEETKNNAQTEVHNLQIELSRTHTLAKQNQDEHEKSLAQVRAELNTVQANATGSAENDKARQVEILNLHNELDSTRTELKYTKEEMEAQKAKNNELREKSWKVIEALKSAEKVNEDSNKQLNDTIKNIRTEYEEEIKEFLRRLFPKIWVNENIEYEKFTTEYKIAVNEYVNSLIETAGKIGDEVNSQQMKIAHLEFKVHEYEVNAKTNNAKYLETVNESKRLKESIGKYKAQIVEDTDTIKKLKTDYEEENKKFLIRLFPDITINTNTKYEIFTTEFEKAVHAYINSKTVDIMQKVSTKSKEEANTHQTKISEMQKQLQEYEEKEKSKAAEYLKKDKEITTLEETVAKYKTIIEDAENMLNQLETNIGTEVTTWKAKLVAKEEELKLNTILTQNQLKELSELKDRLLAEQRLNKTLAEEYEALKSEKSLEKSFQNPEIINEKISKLIAIAQIKTENNEDKRIPENVQVPCHASNGPLGDTNESQISTSPSSTSSNASQTNCLQSSNKTKKKKSKK